MSNIYIQEPPSHGKVLLETTAGDIDIELWSREAPKACRNFVQLCMEGYYNGTIFHRLVKTFIVQGGDPTGTGQGGKSIWGSTFKDEFHSRLRFVRRGLVAMANAGKDDNGSQFFFTLGPTPELQNKHTLFGKVTGNTIYNMLKLEEGETDHDEKPIYPHKILSTKILLNPFDDIVPRQSIKQSSSDKKKDKREGTKNYKLLSFGEEAEEEEEEVAVINKKYSGKSKSSHDLTNDPKLSSQLAIEPNKKDKKRKHSSSDDDDDDNSLSPHSKSIEAEEQTAKNARLLSVQEKLKSKSSSESKKPKAFEEVTKSSSKNNTTTTSKSRGGEEVDDDDDDETPYYLGKDEEVANKKKLDDLKKEYKELRGSIKKAEKDKIAATTKGTTEDENEGKSTVNDNNLIEEFIQRQKQYKVKTASSKTKGAEREAATLALLSKFSKKLETAKEKPQAEVTSTKIDDQDDPQDDSWLTKSLHNEEEDSETPKLAKDANLKSDDWADIHDPRNAMVQRRRHEAKRIAASTRPKRDLI